MSNARDKILDKLRGDFGLGIAPALDQHLNQPWSYPAPRVSEPLPCFVERLKALDVGVHRLAHPCELSVLLDQLRAKWGVAHASHCCAEGLSLEWAENSGEQTDLLVSAVSAAIAETGTLMICANRPADSRALFLAERHLAVVFADQVLAQQDQAWALMRSQTPPAGRVHFITGPSKTGDVEQTLVVGAHGPVALDVVLIESRG